MQFGLLYHPWPFKYMDVTRSVQYGGWWYDGRRSVANVFGLIPVEPNQSRSLGLSLLGLPIPQEHFSSKETTLKTAVISCQ
jgi:hypothetical protein